MNKLALKLYHGLPVPLRALVANARGYQLRTRRYGPETDRLVREAHERESWTPEQWESWRSERLRRVLSRAKERVPYYRNHWNERRRKGDRSSWELLENWPVLEKEALRANPAAFVADDCDIRKLYLMSTSGSSGTPLQLRWSRDTTRAWFALFEARWRQWNGVSRHDRWGILGGQVVAPVERKSPPYWIWNAPMNQLYLSAFHLSEESIPHYLEAIRNYRVRFLWGYPSALFQLASVANQLGQKAPLEVVLANAEPLFEHQREVIGKAFQCPVRETYGMAEIVAGAGECQFGSLHLWPEAGIVEVMEGDQPVSPGAAGDVIATGLVNLDMPLIRYRLGDRAVLAPSVRKCDCGRTLPLLESVEGRLDDVIITPDGRRIGRLDPLFKGSFPIREAQVIQEELARLLIRFVPSSAYTSRDGERIRRHFQDYLGPMQIELEPVSRIAKSANGKFRAVISKVKYSGDSVGAELETRDSRR